MAQAPGWGASRGYWGARRGLRGASRGYQSARRGYQGASRGYGVPAGDTEVPAGVTGVPAGDTRVSASPAAPARAAPRLLHPPVQSRTAAWGRRCPQPPLPHGSAPGPRQRRESRAVPGRAQRGHRGRCAGPELHLAGPGGADTPGEVAPVATGRFCCGDLPALRFRTSPAALGIGSRHSAAHSAVRMRPGSDRESGGLISRMML